MRRAVIDVGTNSVKLLVAELLGRDIRPVWEESRQTRLGQGFYETRRLQAEPICRTAEAVAAFAARAREYRAAAIRVIATSAARDALNAAELISAVERASGLKVEVISGDQEADWAFAGATTDPALADTPLLLLDVGGGSTEFILGRGARKHFARSFPIGSVRLLEQLPPGDPPRPEELAECRRRVRGFLDREVRPQLQPALREFAAGEAAEPVRLIGTGGTASMLGRMETGLPTFERDRIEAACLSRERVSAQVQRLWGLPLAERRRIPGLPPNRADVILSGSAIYEGILERFDFDQLRISKRGLRFAAVRGQ